MHRSTSFRRALRILLLCSVCWALVAGTGIQRASAALPAIYSLGSLTFQSSSQGLAINASGQVTGISIPASGAQQAFLYTGTPGNGGSMAGLGTLGGTQSVGAGINASGQVAGSSYPTNSTSFNAFLYTGTPGHGGAMADLGTLGGTYSVGSAINASGQVAGYSSTAGGVEQAFLYSGVPGHGGSMVDLGSGTNESEAYGINDSGQVVGVSGGGGAFIYTGIPGQGGTMAFLGTLGGFDAIANGINNGGEVTGYSTTTTRGNVVDAFLYTGTPGHGGAMADLGSLGGTTTDGEAINSAGDVVGWGTTAGNADNAFLYVGTPGHGGQMINLNTWLDASNPAAGAQWTLQVANGISDSGMITGYGATSSGTQAFLLDASSLIPEPTTLSLVAIAGITLLCRRSR